MGITKSRENSWDTKFWLQYLLKMPVCLMEKEITCISCSDELFQNFSGFFRCATLKFNDKYTLTYVMLVLKTKEISKKKSIIYDKKRILLTNPSAFRKAKTLSSFGLSECSRIKHTEISCLSCSQNLQER